MTTATKYMILYFGVESRVVKDDQCQASSEHSEPEW